MANLTDSTTWEGNVTQETQNTKYTFQTRGKYVDRDIEFNVGAKSGTAKTPDNETALSSTSTSLSSTTLTVQASVIPVITEGWVSNGEAGTVKISGTVPTETKSATPTSSSQDITPSSGKLLSKVTVAAVATETNTVTPTTSDQTITPTSGKFFSSVTVKGITSEVAQSTVGTGIISSSSTSDVAANANCVVSTTNDSGISVKSTGTGAANVTIAGYVDSSANKTSESTSTTKYVNEVTLVADSTKVFKVNDGNVQ